MALDIVLTSHIDLSGIQVDVCSMPQEAAWSGTVVMMTRMDTAGMMTMIRAVTIGNIQEVVVIGRTPGAVVGEKTTDQSLLLTPQPDALLVKLVFPAITGHRFKRVFSKVESPVCKSWTMGRSPQQVVVQTSQAQLELSNVSHTCCPQGLLQTRCDVCARQAYMSDWSGSLLATCYI